jgi:hypothetical protein
MTFFTMPEVKLNTKLTKIYHIFITDLVTAKLPPKIKNSNFNINNSSLKEIWHLI